MTSYTQRIHLQQVERKFFYGNSYDTQSWFARTWVTLKQMLGNSKPVPAVDPSDFNRKNIRKAIQLMVGNKTLRG